MKRILAHLAYPAWRLRRAFPKSVRAAIEAAVHGAEAGHPGEVRFVVEGGLALPQLLAGVDARQRAIELFSSLRVWDTEHNSGVLIYVQLADRRVEIVADRGIDARVGNACWRDICAGMEQAFAEGDFGGGALRGIAAVGRLLAEHFPAPAGNPDELPDAPLFL